MVAITHKELQTPERLRLLRKAFWLSQAAVVCIFSVPPKTQTILRPRTQYGVEGTRQIYARALRAIMRGHWQVGT